MLPDRIGADGGQRGDCTQCTGARSGRHGSTRCHHSNRIELPRPPSGRFDDLYSSKVGSRTPSGKHRIPCGASVTSTAAGSGESSTGRTAVPGREHHRGEEEGAGGQGLPFGRWFRLRVEIVVGAEDQGAIQVDVDGRQALARTVATVADPVDTHDTVQLGYTVSQSAGSAGWTPCLWWDLLPVRSMLPHLPRGGCRPPHPPVVPRLARTWVRSRQLLQCHGHRAGFAAPPAMHCVEPATPSSTHGGTASSTSIAAATARISSCTRR